MARRTSKPARRNIPQQAEEPLGVAAYRQAIEEFVEEQLREYTPRVEAMAVRRERAGKEINDAVWRTIWLSSLEVIILDSPLMQRLRRVRQLGVVHWIYPCAGHTRLEHSIGAVYQMQRLVESLNRDAGDGKALSQEWVNLLRLTALVHDIGHGLMSHVVENAFESSGVTEKLKLDLVDKLELEKCSLSEAAAYFMAGSDSFAELVDAAVSKTAHQLPDGWQEKLCNAIVGRPIHSRWPLLQELISGPFDADKLDYMSRDAQSAGIPNLTDIPRLIQKVRVAEVSEVNLPREIGRNTEAGQPSYFIQGILLSGGRTLDELMIARTLLFDKVYRHQKTRAVEAMLANAVSALLPALLRDHLLKLPLTIADDDFISLTRDTIPSRLPIRPGQANHAGVTVAADIIARIRDRNLFVRAYAFAHTMPHDPFRDDIQQRKGLSKLREAFSSKSGERRELLVLISDAAKEIVALADDILGVNAEVHVGDYIALDPFARSTDSSEIARAYLVRADRKLVRFRDDSAESPPWSNAYLMTRDLGYVFSAGEYAPAVYLACEAVFRQRYGIRTPPSAIDYAKIDRDAVEAVRQRLADRGFYAGKSPDLKPVPKRLGKGDVGSILKEVADRLRLFQPFAQPGEGTESVVVDETRLRAWLHQFRNDEEVDCALQLLRNVKILTRADVRSAVDQFLSRHNEFKGCYLCQLGGPRDSSAVITYYAQDLADSWGVKAVPLQDALAEADRPILFVDDYLGTGRQAVSIMKKWLNETYEEQLDEDHGKHLPAVLAQAFRKGRLGFSFVLGTKPGEDRLIEEMAKSGIKASVYVHQNESTLPRAFGEKGIAYVSQEAGQRFETRCRDIGAQLLNRQQGREWDEAKIADRALGYGNNSYLIVFPYNVPTACLTMLWSEGSVDGNDWMPLLPRRKKM